MRPSARRRSSTRSRSPRSTTRGTRSPTRRSCRYADARPNPAHLHPLGRRAFATLMRSLMMRSLMMQSA
eukprot:5398666-Prymnesium_polylepis.1